MVAYNTVSTIIKLATVCNYSSLQKLIKMHFSVFSKEQWLEEKALTYHWQTIKHVKENAINYTKHIFTCRLYSVYFPVIKKPKRICGLTAPQMFALSYFIFTVERNLWSCSLLMHVSCSRQEINLHVTRHICSPKSSHVFSMLSFHPLQKSLTLIIYVTPFRQGQH